MAENNNEKDLLKDLEFDGIQELNNPPPPWIMWVLYATIIFAGLYMVHYHVYDTGVLQEEEYAKNVEEAELQLKLAKQAMAGDAQSDKMTEDDLIALGEKVYAEKICATCHGQNGEGNQVGPNLTDEYWLHGGTKDAIFKSIKIGIPAKGMMPYKDQMNDEKIEAVAAYIMKKLVGSNPPNAKDPQGEKM